MGDDVESVENDLGVAQVVGDLRGCGLGSLSMRIDLISDGVPWWADRVPSEDDPERLIRAPSSSDPMCVHGGRPCAVALVKSFVGTAVLDLFRLKRVPLIRRMVHGRSPLY